MTLHHFDPRTNKLYEYDLEGKIDGHPDDEAVKNLALVYRRCGTPDHYIIAVFGTTPDGHRYLYACDTIGNLAGPNTYNTKDTPIDKRDTFRNPPPPVKVKWTA